MKVRKTFRNEPAAALRLVESAENLAAEGLVPMNLARTLRKDYEDAQVPRPDDDPIPFYYTR